jgi:FlaA1/EpsC-like NDP-sugar epimerase
MVIDINSLIGREKNLFEEDIKKLNYELCEEIQRSSFLVIGGAGSIGQSVTKEIFKRKPKLLHVIDISENNLVELVRDIRSTIGYSSGEFATFAIDCGGLEFNALVQSSGTYDYVFNLSALKHVRSEKDLFTLMRLTQVNIFNTVKTLKETSKHGSKKYFCVSTDKATNPVNMMGASKRIMELFLNRESAKQNVSMARFANVAFSDGSLLYGFNQRLIKRQPISAPNDVRRYFINSQEAGELCLLSGVLGNNREILFPKLSEKLHLTTFSEIATRYLNAQGYEPYHCESEEEARTLSTGLIQKNKWPCYFFKSDTTGEKDFEEFFSLNETVDMTRFEGVGVISNSLSFDEKLLVNFSERIAQMRNCESWSKTELVELYKTLLPEFNHKETGKYLDQKM